MNDDFAEPEDWDQNLKEHCHGIVPPNAWDVRIHTDDLCSHVGIKPLRANSMEGLLSPQRNAPCRSWFIAVAASHTA